MPGRRAFMKSIRTKAREIRDNSVPRYISEPVFNLFGNREFFAEGCISVEKYGECEIVLRVNSIIVSVSGRDLSMCFYSSEKVKLEGFMTSVTFERTKG